MKILRLTAENIKKLKAVEITPAGDIVTIAGKNGAGKTSVLDSIWWALTGTKHIQGQPIRKGENKARVRLDLGELVVERKFTPTGSTLTVESTEGARFPSPQKMLDALLGELSFDPLAFARMEPRDQFDELRRVSKLSVDVDALDRLNAGDYDKRTDVNRDAKAKRAQADGVPVPAEVPGAVLVDEVALVDEMQRAGEANAEIERRRARRDTAQAEATQAALDGENAAVMAARVRAEADAQYERAGVAAKAAYDAAVKAAGAALKAGHDDADQWGRTGKAKAELAEGLKAKLAAAEALPEPVDVSALREKIAAARTTNHFLVARKEATERKAALVSEAAALEASSKEITARMDARTAEKQKAIETAEMPIAGIGFGEGVVTFNGIPFDQASSAEQLRISMSIAMAANPKLRVIRITDGSLLDEDSLAAIGEMAKAEDFQVWIEMVSSSGQVGVVIDDGNVVSTPETRT